MRYLGGKSRICKQVAEILQVFITEEFYAPFCGACWVESLISAPSKYLSDAHPDLILMWKALQSGWEPPAEVSEDLYNSLRAAEPSSLRGFVGFGCSFGGKFFGGYARNSRGDNYAQAARNSLCVKVSRIVATNAKNSVQAKSAGLADAIFRCRSYKEVFADAEAVVYCDPPYANTTKYSQGAFDSEVFWQWVREQEALVFVSEYAAPDDFTSVAEFQTKTDLRNSGGTFIPRVERLFVHNSRAEEVLSALAMKGIPVATRKKTQEESPAAEELFPLDDSTPVVSVYYGENRERVPLVSEDWSKRMAQPERDLPIEHMAELVPHNPAIVTVRISSFVQYEYVETSYSVGVSDEVAKENIQAALKALELLEELRPAAKPKPAGTQRETVTQVQTVQAQEASYTPAAQVPTPEPEEAAPEGISFAPDDIPFSGAGMNSLRGRKFSDLVANSAKDVFYWLLRSFNGAEDPSNRFSTSDAEKVRVLDYIWESTPPRIRFEEAVAYFTNGNTGPSAPITNALGGSILMELFDEAKTEAGKDKLKNALRRFGEQQFDAACALYEVRNGKESPLSHGI